MRAPRIATLTAACLFLLLAGGVLAGCGGSTPEKQAEAASGGHAVEEPEEAEAKKQEAEEKKREAALEAEAKRPLAASSTGVPSKTKHGSRGAKHRSRGSKHGSHKSHSGSQPQSESGTSTAHEEAAPTNSRRSSRATVVGYHAELPAAAPTGSALLLAGGTTSAGSSRGKTKQPKQPKHPKSGRPHKEARTA